jgi:hypothetical protein
MNKRGYLCWNFSFCDATAQIRPRLPHCWGPYVTHDYTHIQSVGPLWKSDPSDAENSTLQYITLTRDRHPSTRRDSNSQFQKRMASDLCLRPHGCRDGHTHTHICINISFILVILGGRGGYYLPWNWTVACIVSPFRRAEFLHEFFLTRTYAMGDRHYVFDKPVSLFSKFHAS